MTKIETDAHCESDYDSDECYITELSDFTQPKFGHIRTLITIAAYHLGDSVLRGSIGHPHADCTDEDYLSMPCDSETPFTISNVHMRHGSKCWGTVRFTDTPVAKRARLIYTQGGRFSVRSVDRGSAVEIVTWDLVER